MKKTLLVTALAGAMGGMAALPAHAMSADRAAQGFTDIMGDFTTATVNPANLTRFNDNDDIYLKVGVGAQVSDEDKTIDDIDDASDILDDLKDQTDAADAAGASASADALRAKLSSLDGKTPYARTGVDFSIAIPNKTLSAAVFATQRGRVAVRGNYTAEDDAYLQDVASGNATFDETLLTSSAEGKGYSIADAGISLAHEFALPKNAYAHSIGLGTNLKYQRLDVLSYSSTVGNFDESDVTDKQYRNDSSGFNADVGAVVNFDAEKRWTIALAAQDLKENSVKAPDGTEFKTDTRVTAGAGYQGNLFSLTTQVDLTEHGEMGDMLEPVKYAAVGGEFNVWDQAALRVGYRTDLNDNEDDVITAGVGISPFNLFSLDVAAFKGDGDNYGAVIQTGVRF